MTKPVAVPGAHLGLGSVTHGLASGGHVLSSFVPLSLLADLVGGLTGLLVLVAAVSLWGLRRPVRR